MNAKISRRQFISYSLTSSALILTTPSIALAQSGSKPSSKDDGLTLTPLIEIGNDNKITFYYPSPEMGQGVDTSLAMIFIEELGGDMSLVEVDPMPYLITRDEEDKIIPVAVPQFAGGSTSISRNFPLLRQAGASTRQLFIQAAAKFFDVPESDITIRDSLALTKNGRSTTLGALTQLAAAESLPGDFKPKLSDRSKWQTIGKSRPSTQTKKIVTGQALYGMDMEYPNAKIAMVARSPYLDGEVKILDSTAALKMAGVHTVVELERPPLGGNYSYLAAGVAVIADDFWTAKKARDLLVIEWDKGPHTNESTESLDQQCKDLLKGKGQIVRDDGDFDAAIKAADKVVSRTYQLPLVSHAQLEPQNCIAHVTDTSCKIIGPTQSPGGASRIASQITGLDRLDIELQYTRLGGGFGRRLTSDHVAEAVTIAKKSGLPIKLIWTREDDLAHDFYRPMGHHQVTAAVDIDGKVTAWQHRLAGTPKYYRRDYVKPEELFGADMYIDDFPAGLVDNLQNEYFPAKSGTPQGSWRAPAHTVNAFVIQSFMDELASELAVDPLKLRLQMLGEPKELPYSNHGGPIYETGRMSGVLKRVAEMADWGRDMPKNRALGLSGHFTFGGYCAQIADVEMLSASEFKVHQVFCAIDVGTVVNPEGVIAQVEGGINDGLSAAMAQKIVVKAGKVTSDNFDTYPMLRIGESVTKIDVSVIDSLADPAGAGEMGLPPLAAAVANAVARAGGPRMRQQPFREALAAAS